MYHVERDELAHARRNAVVSLSFGEGVTNCSQGKLLYTLAKCSVNCTLF